MTLPQYLPKIDRLVAIAAREQWNVDDLDWSIVNFQGIPPRFQKNIATAFSHLLFGEQAALQCAQRLKGFLHHPTYQRLCDFQITDETRHCAFFSQLLSTLPPPANIRDSMQQLIQEICTEPDFSCLLVGMHILIESIAQALFHAACAVVQMIPAGIPMISSITHIIREWIPDRLAADESRHIAFGHILLQEHLPTLTPRQHILLEKKIKRWGDMVYDMACDPILLYHIGIVDMQISTQCIKEVNLRLEQLKLKTQIPLPTALR